MWESKIDGMVLVMTVMGAKLRCGLSSVGMVWSASREQTTALTQGQVHTFSERSQGLPLFINDSSFIDPANGVKMKIWTCYEGLAAQQWYWTDDNRIALTGKGSPDTPVLTNKFSSPLC